MPQRQQGAHHEIDPLRLAPQDPHPRRPDQPGRDALVAAWPAMDRISPFTSGSGPSRRAFLKFCALTASLLAAVALMLPALCTASADMTVATAVQKALASGQPTLIEFGADTCSQCKRMKVVLDGVTQRYRGRAHVVQVNVNRDRDVTRQFKVMVIPTLVFFDARGREVGRSYGFMDEVKVARKLHELGAR